MKNGRFEVGDIITGRRGNRYYGLDDNVILKVVDTYKDGRYYRMNAKIIFQTSTWYGWYGPLLIRFLFNNTKRFRLLF